MALQAITDLPEGTAAVGTELLEVSQLSETVTITGVTISALASDNSFNDSAAGLVTAGFAVGDGVNVVGFTGNVVNNIVKGVITVLTTGKMTIGGTDGDVIVDDAAGESVTISKWVSRRLTAQDIADLAGSGLPAGGADGDVLTKQSGTDFDADWAAPTGGGGGDTIYRIGFFFTGALAASEIVLLHTISDDCTFANDFAGSVADVGTNPAATFTLDVQVNGSSVGSIAISTSGVFTFLTTGGALALVAGDQVKVVGPATVGTAANVSITLKADI